MKRFIFTSLMVLVGSVNALMAQVKLTAGNVDEVLRAMTLEEKAMLVVGGNRKTDAAADNMRMDYFEL